MSVKYEKFLYIITKWPSGKYIKDLDYGLYLKQKLKDKDIDGNIFSKNEVENRQMLESLLRLVKNVYGNKYSSKGTIGASGIDLKSTGKFFTEEFIEFYKKKSWTLKVAVSES